MKWNILFEHKEVAVTCEENLGDVKEYQNLLEPSEKLKKSNDMSQIEKNCGYCHKIGRLKDHCHWNLENPNNKLKEKKEVLV
jgi:hypothetical protein